MTDGKKSFRLLVFNVEAGGNKKTQKLIKAIEAPFSIDESGQIIFCWNKSHKKAKGAEHLEVHKLNWETSPLTVNRFIIFSSKPNYVVKSFFRRLRSATVAEPN